MSERRTLIDGLKATPTVDPRIEREFVRTGKMPQSEPPPVPTVTVNRVPISTRLREDFAKSLKRASLERQLKNIEPNTLQDILEEALEPWLRANGYTS
jgi:hypothetical protein